MNMKQLLQNLLKSPYLPRTHKVVILFLEANYVLTFFILEFFSWQCQLNLTKSTWRAHSCYWIYSAGSTSAWVCFDQTWCPLEWRGEKSLQRVWKESQRAECWEGELQKGITAKWFTTVFATLRDMIFFQSGIHVNKLTLCLQLLETEMKKLLMSNKDAAERFDETLKKLFEKKKTCEMAIYQVSTHTKTHRWREMLLMSQLEPCMAASAIDVWMSVWLGE